MNKRDLWAWICEVSGMHNQKISKLISKLYSVEGIYNATEKQLIEYCGLKEVDAHTIIESKKKFNPDIFWTKLEKANCHFVTVEEDDYPQKLKPYDNKPYYLFYKGKLPDEAIPTVAMVGARDCSNYGRSIARKIAKELSDYGVQIISGMARGIDTYSGLGSVSGSTPGFAVLGCGADVCYPSENIELYNDILKCGGIISEYPLHTKPTNWHFPQRNRIISGMADIVLLIEARVRSGSLITTEWALEQGKDIMAVPGRIGDPLSEGCNRLIHAGANIVTSVEDILQELPFEEKYKKVNKKIEEKILEKHLGLLYSELSLQPMNIYTLMEKTSIPYEELVEGLLQLQLMGMVEQTAMNYYSIIKK